MQRFEYSPFGKEIFALNPNLSFDPRFTGQEYDIETGLYYFKARYYNPILARFIQPDTIVGNPKDPQSFNRYSYVNNNPMKYVDPTGHLAWGEEGPPDGQTDSPAVEEPSNETNSETPASQADEPEQGGLVSDTTNADKNNNLGATDTGSVGDNTGNPLGGGNGTPVDNGDGGSLGDNNEGTKNNKPNGSSSTDEGSYVIATLEMVAATSIIATGAIVGLSSIPVFASVAVEAGTGIGLMLTPHTVGLGGALLTAGTGIIAFGIYLAGDAIHRTPYFREKKDNYD